MSALKQKVTKDLMTMDRQVEDKLKAFKSHIDNANEENKNTIEM